MISRRLPRQIAVVATAGALLLSGIAVPASAKPKAGHGRGYEKSSQAHARNELRKIEHQAKSAGKGKAHGKAKAAAAKARKAARFQATGTLLAVVGTNISVAVKGGHVKTWRGTIVDFDAAGAVVNRDDAPASLLDLQAGDHVAVKGLRVDGVNVAKRVNAESPEPVVEDPAEPVVEDPTGEVVTEDPTEEVVTEDPTEEVVTEDPTEEVVTDGTTDAPSEEVVAP